MSFPEIDQKILFERRTIQLLTLLWIHMNNVAGLWRVVPPCFATSRNEHLYFQTIYVYCFYPAISKKA